MKVATKVIFTIVCLAAGACGDDAASQRKSFVTFWADSTAYCTKIADECHRVTRVKCESDWPKPAAVDHAIGLAKLGTDDLARCETAGRAEDACYNSLSCSTLTSSQRPCAAEDARVQLDCAALLQALDRGGSVVSSAGAGTTAASQTKIDPKVGQTVCEKAAKCQAQPTSAKDLDDCIVRINQAFASVLPDPQATAECLQQLDCNALETDGDGATRDCIDVDPDATHCVGDLTLHICAGNGVCRDISCVDSCELLSATAVACSFNESDGYDKCECER